MKNVNARSRRAILAGIAPAILLNRYRLSAQSPATYSSRTIQVLGDATVVDLLNQFRFADYSDKPPKSEVWLTKPGTFTDADAAVYRGSGIHAFALGHGAPDYESALRYFARWNGFIASYGDKVIRIDDASDFARARRENKTGVLISLQDSSHFRRPDDVEEFFGLGQRISQLTYNFNNKIGSGFLETRDGGLSVFGLSILQRMEKVGMAVDISHCGDVTTLDALAAATKPVLFTHATARGLIEGHMRAKSDEAIQKMAKTGGVMGIAFIRFMILDKEPVRVGNVLDHFDYVRKLVGVEHLAVGSDLDVVGYGNPMGGGGRPDSQPNFARYKYHVEKKDHVATTGLDHSKRMFDLTEGLISRGYSDKDIQLILGGNAVRVLGKIWGM